MNSRIIPRKLRPVGRLLTPVLAAMGMHLWPATGLAADPAVNIKGKAGTPIENQGIFKSFQTGNLSGGQKDSPLTITSALASSQSGPGFVSINGLASAGKLAEQVHKNSLWFDISLKNETGLEWNNVVFRLQTVRGVDSLQPDGLSFGDLSDKKRTDLKLPEGNPWQFSYMPLTQAALAGGTTGTLGPSVRVDPDILTFENLRIANGQSAKFKFLVSENDPFRKTAWLSLQFESAAVPEVGSTALVFAGLMAAFAISRTLRRRRQVGAA